MKKIRISNRIKAKVCKRKLREIAKEWAEVKPFDHNENYRLNQLTQYWKDMLEYYEKESKFNRRSLLS